MSSNSMKVAGIDTGKGELHVCLLPSGLRLTVANNPAGIARLVAKCVEAGTERAGIEATSIYHRRAAWALRKAGIVVVELQPRQVRAFAEALLQWAKNDPIDAFIVARLTQALDVVRAAPDVAIEAFAEFLTYIEQLEERIVRLKTSLERYSCARLKLQIGRDIKRLEKCRLSELRKLEGELRKIESLSVRLDLLLSIPGVAERTALAFLIRMPELGTLSREQAARLAGLAPLDDDSSKHKGERHIYGGRSRLRKTAFMAAFVGATHWNGELKIFYRRLRERGKAHVEAIIACARKLIIYANTVLARGTPWEIRRGMPCLGQ